MKKSSLSYVRFFTVLLFIALFAACSENGGGSGQNESGTYSSSSSGVSAKSTSSSVYLGWDLEGEEFKISYYDAKGAKLGEEVIKGNKASIDNLTIDKSYTFVIESDNESIFAFASTSKGTQPTKIGAVANDGSAKVIWEAIPDALDYELYVSKSQNGEYTKVGTYTNSSAKVYNLDNGVTYFFRVQANFNKDDAKAKVQSFKPTLASSNNQITPLSVLPGYKFGEVTAVTPGDADNYHINHFRAVKRDFQIYFYWDATFNAKSYNIKHSEEGINYTTKANTLINSYILDLPVEKPFFKVASLLDNNYEPSLSHRVEITYKDIPEWKITGGINSIKVNHANFPIYENVELYCIGEGESEWLHTKITKGIFTAGWLEGNKNYLCKLKTTLKGIESETNTKKIYVLNYPESGKNTSMYLYDDNAKLSWESSSLLTYNIYLQKNDGEIIQIAKNIKQESDEFISYEINDLICNTKYNAYLESVSNGKINHTYAFDEFTLDKHYCEHNQKYRFRKLKPTGDIPPESFYKKFTNGALFGCTLAVNSIDYDNKIYIPTFDGLYMYDTDYGTDGKWVKFNTYMRNRASAIGVYNNKFYSFGGYRPDMEHSNDIFVMDLSTGSSWKKLEPSGVTLPKFSGYNGIFFNGKFYLPIGNELYIYDPEENSLSLEILQENYTRNGYVFIFNNLIYHKDRWKNKLIAYNPFTKKEIVIDTKGEQSNYPASALYNNKIYSFGGYRAEIYDRTKPEEYSNYSNIYNIVTGKNIAINPVGEVPGNRAFATLNEINGKLYLIGGKDYGDTPYGCLNDVYVFEP